MDNPNIIQVKRAKCLTDAVLTELQRHHKGLNVNAPANGNTIDLYVSSLSQSQRNDLMTDIGFKAANPSLPLENLCCTLDNYNPKNSSQEELVHYAQQLIDLEISGRAAGLFMYGDAGIGKTHVAIGVTKELMKKGQIVHYLDASNVRHGQIEKQLGSDQVWVLDDLNSPYSQGMDTFKKVVLNAHNNGGRVFVTSNTTYDDLIEHGFTVDRDQKPRFEDRIKSMFKVLHISGKSARQDDKWFDGMGFTQTQILNVDLAKAVQDENYELAAKIRDQIESSEKEK